MPRKNPAAVELGRKGGKATARKLSLEERIESARRAAQARWSKQRAELKELNQGAKQLLAKAREPELRAKQKTKV